MSTFKGVFVLSEGDSQTGEQLFRVVTNAPKQSLGKQIVGDKLACREKRPSVAVGVAGNPK